jgi:CspA family cold shock protein
MPTGKVKWWRNENGLGFIETESSQVMVFVHHLDIEGPRFQHLTEGEIVSFEIEQTEKGPMAKHVKKLGKSGTLPVKAPTASAE